MSTLAAIQQLPYGQKAAAYAEYLTNSLKAHQLSQLQQCVAHIWSVEATNTEFRNNHLPYLLNTILLYLADDSLEDEYLWSIEEMQQLTEFMLTFFPQMETLDKILAALYTRIVWLLVECLRANGQYRNAANMLSNVKFDAFPLAASSTSSTSPSESKVSTDILAIENPVTFSSKRVEWFTFCTELFLEEVETALAYTALKKAQPFVPLLNPSTDLPLIIRYKVSFARCLDSERKYFEAATSLYAVSIEHPSFFSADDMRTTLIKVVNFAILGKPSARRTRFMSELMNDKRCYALPNYLILKKFTLNQFIFEAEMQQWKVTLEEHHFAVGPYDLSAVDLLLLQHNCISLSKTHTTICYATIEKLLGIKLDLVLKIIISLIETNRIQAKLDQVDKMIEFFPTSALTENSTDSTNSSNSVPQNQLPFLSWNEQIGQLCMSIEQTIDGIKSLHPDLVM